jgi:hypothetical protein
MDRRRLRGSLRERTDDPQDARAAAEKHAKGRVEPEYRRRLEPVTD